MPEPLPNALDGSGLIPKIFVGDTDTALVLRLFDLSTNAYQPLAQACPPPLDLSGATVMQMRIEKPGDSPGDPPIVQTVTATFASATTPPLPQYVGDGSDGYLEFRAPSGFFDRPGRWRRQAVVTIPPGTWSSDVVEFDVEDILS